MYQLLLKPIDQQITDIVRYMGPIIFWGLEVNWHLKKMYWAVENHVGHFLQFYDKVTP